MAPRAQQSTKFHVNDVKSSKVDKLARIQKFTKKTSKKLFFE